MNCVFWLVFNGAWTSSVAPVGVESARIHSSSTIPLTDNDGQGEGTEWQQLGACWSQKTLINMNEPQTLRR